MSTRDEFHQEVEEYLRRSGMAYSTFGAQIGVGRSFVLRLRAGKDIQSRTIDRVRDWMRKHPLARKKTTTRNRAAHTVAA